MIVNSRYKYFIVLFAVITGSVISHKNIFAQVDAFQFDNAEQQSRFRQLSDELRCPMCQNTNLSGSTGGVAEDLRREIHRMIMGGMSNKEIEQFMFERYGDFIFYRPRLRVETVLLWFGPLIFLSIGGFIAYGIFRRAKEADETEDDILFPGTVEEERPVLQEGFSKGVMQSMNLFLLFWAFGIPALVIYFSFLLLIFFYFFSVHYLWKGAGIKWLIYRIVNELWGSLSRIPPYLLLVVTVFWLGFQTFDSCAKQFAWVIALFFVLLPTQLISIGGWIEEATNARFLVARRSLGINSARTFSYLLMRRWLRGLLGLVTFSLGLVLLMDVSMIWLLGDRGSFTCDSGHWLNQLRRDDIRPYEAVMVWSGYPIIMYLCIQRYSSYD